MGVCTKKNHTCCKEGLDEQGRASSDRKRETTFRSQVERLKDEKKLSPRHKTWLTMYNERIKKSKKIDEIKAQAAKHEQEATEGQYSVHATTPAVG